MSIDAVHASADSEPALQSALAAAWDTLSRFRVVAPHRNNLFVYFRSLDDVLTAVHDAGGIASAEAAMGHIDYLADKAGCSAAVILGGGHFAAEPQVILDTLANINDVLQTEVEHTDRNVEIVHIIDSDSVHTDQALRGVLTLAWKTLSDFGSSFRGGGCSFIPMANGLSEYFNCLNDVLKVTKKLGASELYDAVMTHIDYLAGKAGCDSAVILSGGPFAAEPNIIAEALGNIGFSLRRASRRWPKDLVNSKLKMVADADPEVQTALVLARQMLSEFRAPPSAGLLGYFRSLNDLLISLNGLGETETVEAVMNHLDYLAYRAGCDLAAVLCGKHFSADPRIILEVLANVDAELRTVAPEIRKRPPVGIPDDVFALIVEAESTLEGWCSREKALVIARAVLQERPKTCVEIGIFGGRSLVPCAAALSHIGAGAIYGIEAWSPNVAIENVTNEINDYWWSTLDFPSIKRAFYRFVAEADLTRHVRLIEAASGRAAALFDEIDFLHIDGSHSMLNAAEDVLLYARKVRSGGIVIFDDVNWQSTAPARALLGTLCDTVTVLKDPPTGLDICAVLRRR